MIPWLANHLWQSTLCFGVAVLLVRALRRQDARWRYAIWLTASLKFLVPFALLAAIGARLPSPARQPASTVSVSVAFHAIGEPFDPGAATAWNPLAAPGAAGPAAALLSSRAAQIGLLGVWALGSALLVAVARLRGRRVRDARRAASPLGTGREADALERARANVPLMTPVALLASDTWLEPAVVGILRPAILWPSALTARLTDAEMDAIFTHELLHIRRRDNLAAALHSCLRTVFWFHPALWWLEGRLLDERERACDAAVLDLGSEPRAYAGGILKVCDFCLRLPFPSAAGVSGANLTQRVEDIMNARTSSSLGPVRKAVLALAAAGLVVVPIAAGSAHGVSFPYTPEPRNPASQSATGRVSGRVTDQRGDPIEDAEIKLGSDPKAPATAVTDAAGRYSLDLPPAQYEFRIEKPGFASSRATIFVSRGASLQQNVQLRIGSVAETLTIVATSAELQRTKSYLQQGRYAEAEATVDQALAQLGAVESRANGARAGEARVFRIPSPPPPGAANPVRIGGDIAPPKNIHRVPPVYPPDARAAGVGGIVTIDAIIATDGTVKDARILRGNPLLNQAALDAVLQWTFTPTLLNGAPVEVQMTVTVNFMPQ